MFAHHITSKFLMFFITRVEQYVHHQMFHFLLEETAVFLSPWFRLIISDIWPPLWRIAFRNMKLCSEQESTYCFEDGKCAMQVNTRISENQELTGRATCGGRAEIYL